MEYKKFNTKKKFNKNRIQILGCKKLEIKWDIKCRLQNLENKTWDTKTRIKNGIQNLGTKSVKKKCQIQKQNKILGYKVCHENNGINSIGYKKFKYKISANRIMIT